jgi:hypothetical protein
MGTLRPSGVSKNNQVAPQQRMKLKYALPVTQSALAIFLLHEYQLWLVMTRNADMPGPGPAGTILVLINVPVALVRGVWFRSHDVFWPDWIFVLALAIFWFWVGQEIESRLVERRTPVNIRSQLAKIAIDVLLIVSSVSFFGGFHTEFRWFPWSYFIPSLASSLFWLLGPPVLLGYDLFSMARRKPVIGYPNI